MVHFVGAGSGAADLITVRGARLLGEADQIIYAGSLVNPELLEYRKKGCLVHDSAGMTLEQVIGKIKEAEDKGMETVRLHTGDSSIYGAIREQMDFLDRLGITYDVCRRQFLLRGGGINESGVHASGHIAKCYHYADGGKNAGTGAGEHCVICRSQGDHGGIFKHRNARAAV